MTLAEVRGHWALITGASSGIGREFCQQLAAAGAHLVMVARREQLLNDLAEQFRKTYEVRTLVIPIDLSMPNAAAKVKMTLDKHRIRVRLLCNNAAAGRWGRFEGASAEVYEQMIQLNAATPVALCSLLMPDLTSHDSSAIFNVSSQAAYQPVPFMAVYAATKALLHSFSQALYGECGSDNGSHVLIKSVVPGPTATDFDAQAGAYESALAKRESPEEVVRVVLSQMERDTPIVTNVGGAYKQRLFAALAPSKLVIRTVARMFQPPE